MINLLKKLSPTALKIIPCGYGRMALELGYISLSIGEGDIVLYPKICCDVLMVPAHNLGVKVLFYDVDDQLRPDMESIKKLVSGNSVKAILAIHYFGFSVDLDELKQFTVANGLFLIEDAAHSFSSKQNGYPLGAVGDISILSYRKSVCVVNGAALIVNNDIALKKIDAVMEHLNTLSFQNPNSGRLNKFLHRIEILYGIPFTRIRKKNYQPEVPGVSEHQQTPYKIDTASLKIISNWNVEQEGQRRRKEYLKWVKKLNTKEFKPLFSEIDNDTVPMVAPFLTENLKADLKYFGDRRISAYPWPTLPKYVADNYPNTVETVNKIIVFQL